MPPRRAKSQSVSSDAPATASSMSPPASPKPIIRAPKTSHSRTSSLAKAASSPLATRIAAPEDVKTTTSDVLRYALVIVLSLSLSALLFSLSSEYTAGDLASVSKRLDTWPEITGVLVWQVLKLGTIWFAGLDAADTFSLSLLLNYPSQVLLLYFYNIRPTTAIVTTLINLTSTTLPIYLLRPTAAVHSYDTTKQRSIPRLTRSILSDPITTISTSLLASAIVAVVLEFSFATSLPVFLISHFDGLRSLEQAYRGPGGLPALLVLLLPLGFAIREFLFVSSAASAPTAIEKNYHFDAARATLLQTLWHNVWGWYDAKEKTLLQRTALAITLLGVETAIQTWGTIKGVELEGAIGWAGLWVTAVAVVGVAFGWVEGAVHA